MHVLVFSIYAVTCGVGYFAAGHTVRLFGQKKQSGKKSGGAALSLPKIRKNPLIEIIAINTGYVYCSVTNRCCFKRCGYVSES